MGQAILDEFDSELHTLNKFADLIKRLLGELTARTSVPIDSITSRVKTRDSLERKIQKNVGKYTRLSDITDVCGARVVTYFEDDVNMVAKIIEEEFQIDRANSVDKRGASQPDRFGYTSLHYVASLNRARSALTEHRQFAERKFEIQVRSLLQHAWAEIEHDLGYKSELSVPDEIRRRFARLAGLLELADSEFIAIRKDSEDYERRVTTEMETAERQVSIDSISLRAFIREREAVARIDNRISGEVSMPIDGQAIPEPIPLVSMASIVGVGTIQDLERRLIQNEPDVVSYAKRFLTSDSEYLSRFPRSVLPRGISIVYLMYLLFAQLGGIVATRDALARVNFLVTPDLNALAQEIHASLDSVTRCVTTA